MCLSVTLLSIALLGITQLHYYTVNAQYTGERKKSYQ